MASLSQLLNTARDALSAQSYGLNVTGDNISNASTPGYVRRVAELQTVNLGNQPAGSVTAAGLRRVTDDFTERRTYQANGSSSAAGSRDQTLASLESLFNDQSGTGLGNSLSAVYASFSALASNPTDATTRSNVLNAADTFATRVSSTASTIAQTRSDLKTQAQQTVDQVNQKAQDIAKLSLQIGIAESNGQDASALKDQRDQKLLDMSSLIDVHTFTDGQGQLVVQSAGTTLVEGGKASSLSLNVNSDGSLQLFANKAGGTSSEVTQFLTGGKLQGIFQSRDVDLFNVSKQLDQFVFDVGNAINQQHASGFGADGGTGRNLFDVSGSPDGAALNFKVSVDVWGHPDRVAAASSAFSVPGGSDNAVQISTMADRAVATNNTRTAAEAYGDLVGTVGSLKAGSARDVDTQGAIFKQVQTMQQSESGVSLDEEMVALTKYQNAYQAASKVLNVADQLMQELMTAIGR